MSRLFVLAPVSSCFGMLWEQNGSRSCALRQTVTRAHYRRRVRDWSPCVEAPDAIDGGDDLLVRGNASPARVAMRERFRVKPPRQRKLFHAPCASGAR